MKNEKCIVVLSGGMDSATVLAKWVAKLGKENCVALFVKYGQHTSEKEYECAESLCKYYDIDLITVSTSLKSTGLVDFEDTNYEVRARNPILALQAYNVGYNYFKKNPNELFYLHIALGIQGSDHSDYIDCSDGVVKLLDTLIQSLSNEYVSVDVPYLYSSKADIIKEGMELNVPYNLTWSCYIKEDYPCGVCPSCQLRAEAFEKAGYKDPILEEE